MDQMSIPTYTAFLAGKRLAGGALGDVALAVLRATRPEPGLPVLVFGDADGKPVDLDLRGGEEGVLARYAPAATPAPAPKGRGRPKLGVVAREVTLLPEHWEWLASQPGGASVALRKLVHEARRQRGEEDRVRQTRERAYHVMSSLVGDLPGFEEASRALFAGDEDGLVAQMASWPADVRAYVLELAGMHPQDNKES